MALNFSLATDNLAFAVSTDFYGNVYRELMMFAKTRDVDGRQN